MTPSGYSLASMLDGDRFIHAQLDEHLAAESSVCTAYLEPANSRGFLSAARARAYWAALTPTRLYLIEARVGALKPLLENKSLRIIERATISGAYAAARRLKIALEDGEVLSFVARRTPKHATGQVQFVEELLHSYGNSEQAAKMRKDSRLQTFGGLVLGVAMIGFYGYRYFYSGRAEVSVTCAPNESRVACQATHTSGGADATACWDLRLACRNGHLSIAHGCGFVVRDGTADVNFSAAQFSKLDECDEVVSTDIRNLVVEPE